MKLQIFSHITNQDILLLNQEMKFYTKYHILFPVFETDKSVALAVTQLTDI